MENQIILDSFGLYCIKVLSSEPCWIANWDGDPGRTLIKGSAKTFKNKKSAEKLCKKITETYPNRKVWVDFF
jgi:hypothetical protein